MCVLVHAEQHRNVEKSLMYEEKGCKAPKRKYTFFHETLLNVCPKQIRTIYDFSSIIILLLMTTLFYTF